jgi:hypothetical protein
MGSPSQWPLIATKKYGEMGRNKQCATMNLLFFEIYKKRSLLMKGVNGYIYFTLYGF